MLLFKRKRIFFVVMCCFFIKKTKKKHKKWFYFINIIFILNIFFMFWFLKINFHLSGYMNELLILNSSPMCGLGYVKLLTSGLRLYIKSSKSLWQRQQHYFSRDQTSFCSFALNQSKDRVSMAPPVLIRWPVDGFPSVCRRIFFVLSFSLLFGSDFIFVFSFLVRF